MSINYTIEYEGRRKVFKCAQNYLVQSLLSDAAEEFGLVGGSYQLKYKRKTVDPAQPVRFCNIPNNAVIELEYSGENSKKSASSVTDAPCKIALTINGSSVSATGTFPVCYTLKDVIQMFIDQGRIPSDVFFRNPEVIYLRNTVKDMDTQLASFGVGG